MKEEFYNNLSEEEVDRATQKALEVKERGETKLFILKPENKVEGKPEILVGARMQGAINSLIPVVQELSRRGYPISFLADRPAENTIRSVFPQAVELQNNEPLETVAEREPGLILSGLSINGGPGIEFYLTADAGGDESVGIKHIPTVWVEDYWKASVRGQEKHRVLPDVVCAFDSTSRDLDVEDLSKDEEVKKNNLDKNTKFVVTGSPAFDQLFQEKDLESTKNRVRLELGVGKDDIMISYMGGNPPEDFEDLRLVVEALNKIDFGEKKVKFVARIHPAIFTSGPLSKHRATYQEILSGLKSCELVETMGKFTTDEVNKVTDVVISDYSTEGIKAVFRGKLSLFMLLPGLGLDGLKSDTDGMETLPVIESGASIGVFEREHLVESLRSLLLDPDTQERIKKAQAEYHHLDGKNTERVINAIEELLRK